MTSDTTPAETTPTSYVAFHEGEDITFGSTHREKVADFLVNLEKEGKDLAEWVVITVDDEGSVDQAAVDFLGREKEEVA